MIDKETVELRVHRARLLPKTDPPARQIHIGCGCFVEAFQLGARLLERGAKIELFPAGRYAMADIGAAPVARLSLTEEATSDPLAQYIFSRQTSRLEYHGAPVTSAEFAHVLEDAGAESSKVRLIEKPALSPYLELLDRAMTIESNTVAVNEETRRWFRFSSQEAQQARDGLTFEANGITGVASTFAQWFTDDTEASWNAKGTIDKGLSAFREGLYSARGLLLQSTESNTFIDHVQAGRDCYRLMLALTKHGYFCHPSNQVIQEYSEMDEARLAFEELSGVHPPGKVQMILRVGKSATPFQSYRRKLDSFIERSESAHRRPVRGRPDRAG